MKQQAIQLWAFLGLFLVCGCPGLAQDNSLATTRPAARERFIHPGGLHTQEDLDRMKQKVAEKAHPWIDGWSRLVEDPKARSNYRAAPNRTMGSRQRAQDDARAAYLNALRWYISGDIAHAECAVRILNAWSATVNQSTSGPDQPGLGGIPIGSFALAGEVLRLYPGWAQEDQARLKQMLRTYCYPAVHDFLTRHNGRPESAYWANWDTCNMLALVAIGVFCDDREIFDEGIAYYRHGKGMGAIMNAVPFLYPDGLGQWQESGRDHAHAFGGMGLTAEMCQVAWNQGVDLFGDADSRLLAGAEYEAQFAQWIGVPYTFYNNCDDARQYYISENYHGRLSNCEFYELLYNHYVIQRGLKAPRVKRFAELLRPEGGNADLMGYGTLTYTLDAAASPYPASPVPPVPQDVIAKAGVGRIYLQWSPSGAYSTRGYEILRATSSGGPFTSIYSTEMWTTPRYTDTKVDAGTTYFYAVAAKNQTGTSAQSVEVSATPVAADDLPKDWASADVGTPAGAGAGRYASASNNTFIISGGGGWIGNKADSAHFAYRSVTGDCTITARLTGVVGKLEKTGLLMRESTATGAISLALTTGEVGGGRHARFRTRASTGAEMTAQNGNDYTWAIVWFRLQRSGDQFTAYQSSDGISWHTIGTSTVPMAKTYRVGLAAASTAKGELVEATFDNVTVEVAPPPVPAAPSQLLATRDGDAVRLTWANNAMNPVGIKIECSRDNAHFYEIADLDAGKTRFLNTGLPSGSCSYRIRAYNTGGYSGYSSVASVVLTK